MADGPWERAPALSARDRNHALRIDGCRLSGEPAQCAGQGSLNLRFKCDTDFLSESLDRPLGGKAFSRCRVERPDGVFDVGVLVARESGPAWQVAARQQAVAVSMPPRFQGL
ncbi:MAG: hypothetical protein D6811_07715 [Alphaproteobacteria bacterium]|nr:MAG: hypothetical protein D6811_07715 [Alphaproteobacteria bacterium]